MNALSPWLLAVLMYLLIFLQSVSGGLIPWLGVRLDLLPCLMVYAAINYELAAICMLGAWGGLCFDSLSANPLGVSVLPLVLVGFVIRENKENLLCDEPYAQGVLGAIACALTPLLVLVTLFSMGAAPLIGAITAWQILLMAVAGALLAPVLISFCNRIHRALNYKTVPESSFRPDREILRGKG